MALKRTGGQALLLARFIRKLPSLWRQEQAMAQHQGSHSNRIFIKGTLQSEYYPIFSPEDRNPKSGSFIRTYSLFCHQANAWYMRKELTNFIKYARQFTRFADIGSAEGFYSALFASMHPRRAEILSVDCGSETGCIPLHSQSVIQQNSEAFKPKNWKYTKAYITGPEKKTPEFSLPLDCQIATLAEILEQEKFDPEIIKLDIESSEFDALGDSAMLRYLSTNRPILIVEVHNLELRQRGLRFAETLDKLKHIGYKVEDYDTPDYLKSDNCHVVLSCTNSEVLKCR